VEACLAAATAAEGGDRQHEDLLDAVAVFASAGGEFRGANRSLLEACWRKAVSETDWEALGELAGRGLLSSTFRHDVSRCCYCNHPIYPAKR
jgi:nuclear pore complex protein Nup133